MNKILLRKIIIYLGPNCNFRTELMMEDLSLLCDLFYLPFEHGSQGLQILQEFHWLKTNAQLVIISNRNNETMSKPEVRILQVQIRFSM